MAAVNIRGILIATLAIGPALAGASRAESLFTLRQDVAIEPPPANRAMLYLAREQVALIHRPLPPERLYLDGAPLGLLPPKSFLAVPVESGTHCLTGIGPDADLCLEFVAGRTTFLRLREVIDDRDAVRLEWLLESRELLRNTLRKHKLPRADLTDRGRRHLLEHAGSAVRDTAWETERRREARQTFPLEFDGMWYEDPIDPVNLRREFQQDRIGRLTLEPDTVRFVSKRKSIDIPCDRITHVRFGGTRFTGTAPWVDVLFDTEAGPRYWSFADGRPGEAVATYNRIFTALQAVLDTRGTAADSTREPHTP